MATINHDEDLLLIVSSIFDTLEDLERIKHQDINTCIKREMELLIIRLQRGRIVARSIINDIKMSLQDMNLPSG